MKPKLILGKAGSGKTHLLREIAGSNRNRTLMVVPDETTAFEHNRSNSGIDVVTIDDLCLEIIGSDVRLLEHIDALRLLRSILSSDSIRFNSNYERVRQKPTFARELLEFIEGVAIHRIDIDALLDFQESRTKMEDIRRAILSFRDSLSSQGCCLRCDLPRIAIERLTGEKSLPPVIMIDKSERLTLPQYELLSALSDRADLIFAVDPMMDNNRLRRRLIDELEPEVIELTEQHRVPDEIMALVDPDMTVADRDPSVATLIAEPMVFDEIEAVIGEIDLLVKSGVAYEQIALVVRDIGSMWPPISNMLTGYYIPHIRPETTSGRGVRIMSAETASGEYRAVFVMEMATDRFPRRYPSRQLLHGDDMRLVRSALRKYGIPGALSYDEWYLSERQALYNAVTRTTEHLFISYSRDYINSIDCAPSPFLLEMIGSNEIETDAESAGFTLKLNRVSSLEGLMSTVSRAVSFDGTSLVADGCGALPDQPSEKPISGIAGRRFSHTSIGNYLSCPRKFFYEELLRLSSEKPARVNFGRIIHERLKTIHGKYPEIDKVSRDDLRAEATDRLDEIISRRDFDSEVERIGYLRLARKLLEAYSDWLLESWQDGRRTVLCEETFDIEMAGYRLTGKVDRIDLLPNGGSELIDYKVSATSQSAATIKGKFINTKADPSWKPEDLQLPIYYFGMTESKRIKVEILGLFYLMNLIDSKPPERSLRVMKNHDGDDNMRDRISQDELAESRDLIRSTMNEMSRGIYPAEPRDIRTCARCGFSFICPRDISV